MPTATVAEEKRRTMEAFGAELEIVPSPTGITPELIPRMRARAAELAESLGAYQTDQFTNTDMVGGYRLLGDELAEQVPGADRRAVPLRRHGRVLPRPARGWSACSRGPPAVLVA